VPSESARSGAIDVQKELRSLTPAAGSDPFHGALGDEFCDGAFDGVGCSL
jgi:hypothetical protein